MTELPYKIHTNNELSMMLEGSKPLACFSDEISVLPDENIIPEKEFSPFVISGKFVREEKTLEGPFVEKLGRKAKIRTVIFCIPSELWRMNAMFLLREQFNRTGKWNETLERIEGHLLGYTDEENDLWCSSRFDK